MSCLVSCLFWHPLGERSFCLKRLADFSTKMCAFELPSMLLGCSECACDSFGWPCVTTGAFLQLLRDGSHRRQNIHPSVLVVPPILSNMRKVWFCPTNCGQADLNEVCELTPAVAYQKLAMNSIYVRVLFEGALSP